MANGPRERMVASAVVLLAKAGVPGASFASVLEASDAPRGSIYHHFPDGKDELVAAAVDLAGARSFAVLDSLAGLPAAQVVDGFLAMWRAVLVRSDLTAGCAVLAVVVSPGTPDLLDRAGDTFRGWRTRLAVLLEAGGVQHDDAAPLAATLVAASEGAVVLARAERDLAPFDLVAEQLRRLLGP
ncbi:MAG TPA: TetR/AcrR family transcriptional regulator [Cellulomonas sp.]